MRSYLGMIPLSAKMHRRENRMTILCIMFAVLLITAVFSMTEAAARQETARLIEKHGIGAVTGLLRSESMRSLFPVAAVLFLFVLIAGVFMIAGSLSANVSQRTMRFGMLRCIGMSRRQITRYVRLEALNLCKTAVPLGLLGGTAASWLLCAALRYGVGGEWSDLPQFSLSIIGLVSGTLVGVITVLLASVRPAKKAAAISPVAALTDRMEKSSHPARTIGCLGIESALGVHHACGNRQKLLLMIGSFALSIVLFLCFSVFIDLVNCLLPQSALRADLEIVSKDGGNALDASLLESLAATDGVECCFGRRASFDIPAESDRSPELDKIDLISFSAMDIQALKEDGILPGNADTAPVIRGEAALIISDRSYSGGDCIRCDCGELRIASQLRYDPFSSDGTTDGHTTLIVSDECFTAMTGISDYSLLFIILTEQATEDTVSKIRADLDDTALLLDERENDTSGTYAAFMICAYGFLAVIALVTVLNIANCISMSVTARLKQYGAMRAVGMSVKQLRKMLSAEALCYTISGGATGLALGTLLSRYLYEILVTAHFPYAHCSFPVGQLGCVLAFLAVSHLAGIVSPLRRIRRLSVTENLAGAD